MLNSASALKSAQERTLHFNNTFTINDTKASYIKIGECDSGYFYFEVSISNSAYNTKITFEVINGVILNSTISGSTAAIKSVCKANDSNIIYIYIIAMTNLETTVDVAVQYLHTAVFYPDITSLSSTKVSNVTAYDNKGIICTSTDANKYIEVNKITTQQIHIGNWLFTASDDGKTIQIW